MYAKIENDTIIKVSYALPKSTSITSNFHLLSETKRNMQGWYECVDQEVPYTYEGPDYEYINNQVIRYVKLEDPLVKAKRIATDDLELAYKNKIDLGYTDPTLSVTLRCDDQAVTKFHRLDNTTKNTNKSTLWYFDINGLKHTGTKQEVSGLMVRYNDYMYDLEEVYNDYQVDIASAETVEAVETLTFTF